jgi:hypothetical protein
MIKQYAVSKGKNTARDFKQHIVNLNELFNMYTHQPLAIREALTLPSST